MSRFWMPLWIQKCRLRKSNQQLLLKKRRTEILLSRKLHLIAKNSKNIRKDIFILGHINVGDRCWARNVLLANLKSWCNWFCYQHHHKTFISLFPFWSHVLWKIPRKEIQKNAIECTNAKKYEDALTIIDDAISLIPSNPAAYNDKAQILSVGLFCHHFCHCI